MHDYGIICSYDEVLRFKRSAAVAASTDTSSLGISGTGGAMVQVVVDNFYRDISSPNGKSSTHSLAMILTQPMKDQDVPLQETVPRITRMATKLPIDEDDDDTMFITNVRRNPQYHLYLHISYLTNREPWRTSQ